MPEAQEFTTYDRITNIGKELGLFATNFQLLFLGLYYLDTCQYNSKRQCLTIVPEFQYWQVWIPYIIYVGIAFGVPLIIVTIVFILGICEEAWNACFPKKRPSSLLDEVRTS